MKIVYMPHKNGVMNESIIPYKVSKISQSKKSEMSVDTYLKNNPRCELFLSPKKYLYFL